MLRDMGPVTRNKETSEEMVELTKITLRCGEDIKRFFL